MKQLVWAVWNKQDNVDNGLKKVSFKLLYSDSILVQQGPLNDIQRRKNQVTLKWKKKDYILSGRNFSEAFLVS